MINGKSNILILNDMRNASQGGLETRSEALPAEAAKRKRAPQEWTHAIWGSTLSKLLVLRRGTAAPRPGSSTPAMPGGVVPMWKLNPWGVWKSNKIKELWRARSLLYRRRFLRQNTHFSAFFEIYKIQNPLRRSEPKISQHFNKPFSFFLLIFQHFSRSTE